jgi:hypothetical protein
VTVLTNGRQFINAVDIWMNQYRGVPVQMFRDYVWELFLRILRETPQYTGRAVANWNLSIGSPNFDFDPTLGDEPEFMSATDYFPKPVHEKGDERWMRRARDRARPIKDRIRSGDKVFISNGVLGDKDGDLNFAYMQALQGPGYWAQHLREVNKPYETVQESMIVIGTQFSNKGWQLPRIGGSSVE